MKRVSKAFSRISVAKQQPQQQQPEQQQLSGDDIAALQAKHKRGGFAPGSAPPPPPKLAAPLDSVNNENANHANEQQQPLKKQPSRPPVTGQNNNAASYASSSTRRVSIRRSLLWRSSSAAKPMPVVVAAESTATGPTPPPLPPPLVMDSSSSLSSSSTFVATAPPPLPPPLVLNSADDMEPRIAAPRPPVRPPSPARLAVDPLALYASTTTTTTTDADDADDRDNNNHQDDDEEEEEEEEVVDLTQFKTVGPTIAQAKRKQWMPSMFSSKHTPVAAAAAAAVDDDIEDHDHDHNDDEEDLLPPIVNGGSASKSGWRFSAMRRMSLTTKRAASSTAPSSSSASSSSSSLLPDAFRFHLIPPAQSLVTMPMMLNEDECPPEYYSLDEDSVTYGLSAMGKFSELPSALYYESATHAEHPANPDFPLTAVIVLSLGEATWMCGPASLDYPEARFPALCGRPHKHLKKVELCTNPHHTSNSSYSSAHSSGSFGMDDSGPDSISFGGDAERKKLLDLEWFNDTDGAHAGSTASPKYVLVGDALVYNSDHLLRRPLKQDAVLLPINQEYSWERKTKLAMLCFERIGARAVRICSEELMALQHVTQLTQPTGIVVDMGQSSTRVVCFLQGERCEVTLRKTRAAGKAVTLRMQRMMQELEAVFTQSKQGMEFARRAKERAAFVRPPASGSVKENDSCAPVSVEYSPGSFVLLQREMHECAEILFNPDADEGGMLVYSNARSVQATLLDCLKENDDRDTWEELLANVVVYGGTSRLPGMEARLTHEVRALLDADPMTQSKASALKRKLKIRVVPEAGWAGARELLERESLSAQPEVPNRRWVSRMFWKNAGETGVRVRLEQLSRSDGEEEA